MRNEHATARNLNARDYILHHIPGRLRLRVPGLGRFESYFLSYAGPVKDLLEKLPAIRQVSWNVITENVLIFYDDAAVDETNLLGWLDRIAAIILSRYQRVRAGENLHLMILQGLADLRGEIDRIGADYAEKTKKRPFVEM